MHKSVSVHVRFFFTFESLAGLPKTQGVYFATWSVSRGLGKQSLQGETRKVLQGNDGTATFNHAFELDVKMHQLKAQDKAGKFESRHMKVVVTEEATKGKKVAAKAACKLMLELADLAPLTDPDGVVKVFSVPSKQKINPTLRLTVRAQWLKYDGRVIATAPTAGLRDDGTQREKVEVGGRAVYLLTDQSLSDDEGSVEDPFKPDATPNASPSPRSEKKDAAPERGYTGNALFRRADGEYETPKRQELPSTLKVLEQGKESNPFGGGLFKRLDGEPAGGAVPELNSNLRMLEEAKLAKPEKTPSIAAASSNPFGAPPSTPVAATPLSARGATASSAAVASTPVAISVQKQPAVVSTPAPTAATASKQDKPSPTATTPITSGRSAEASAAAAAALVASPSAEELQMLRTHNKELQEMLEKQEEKIDILRQRVRMERGGGSNSGTSPAGDSNALRVLDEKFQESERQKAALSKALDEERKRLEAEKVRLAEELKRAEQVAADASAKARTVEAERKKAADDLRASEARALSLEAAVAAERRKSEEAAKAAAIASKSKASEREAALSEEVKAKERSLQEAQSKIKSLETSLAIERQKAVEDLRAVESRVQQQHEAAAASKAKGASEEAATLRAKLAEAEKTNQSLELKIQDVTRELSERQLAMLDLTKRLRDAEERSAATERDMKTAGAHSLEGELSSLQMQLAAMEQDYESQLEELRAELVEARESSGGGGGGGAASNKKLEDENAALTAQLKKREGEIVELKAKLAKAEEMVPPSPMGKNPLMVPIPMSPVPAGSVSRDELDAVSRQLRVLQAAQTCVWAAPMEYSGNVAVATGLILSLVKEHQNAFATQAFLFDGVVSALSKAAENQLSLEGRFYWMNVVCNVLHALSDLPSLKGLVKSPKTVGIVLNAGAFPDSKTALGDLPQKLMSVARDMHQSVVQLVRKRIGASLVPAVLDRPMNSKEALGARHNVGGGPTVDAVVAHLDHVLSSALAASLFPSVLKQLFTQVFYDIGVALFNEMVIRSSFNASQAVQIKLEVSNFDNWPQNVSNDVKENLRGISHGLNVVKETCNLLFVDKVAFLSKEFLAETCPSLNGKQVKTLLTKFVPDDICPEKTPQAVLDSIDVKKSDSLMLDEKKWLSI